MIRRVSQLFAGNSTLIQGFNTFLPAGYRIECNADGNPDGIRVLTPQGTFINTFGQELESASGRRPGDPPDPAAPYEDQNRGAGGQMDGAYFGSPSLRPEEAQPRHRHLSPFEGSAQRENHHSGVNAALLAHQQEQRGVAQLQNAASASDQGAMPMQQSVSPSLQATAALPNGLLGGQRGPVEFNHAISYVNKIKVSPPGMSSAKQILKAVQNRFTGQPEIYKNFLEILQTYQRESRPIQDVYSQVTTLFAEAPDLLRDFKQFLPDTTGQTKTEGARPTADELQTSNVRGGLGDQLPRHTPKPEQQRLPPVGNFQPTPTANRDGKRKRGGDRGGPVAPPNFDGPPRGNYAPGKRAKQSQAQQQPPPKQQQQQQTQADAAAVEPTLIPALPHPMDPATTTSATAEELTFFDKVKKHLGNKSTMSDWLKLCNLYSQDLIDLNTLVSRAYEFIGDNVDLYNWFKAFTNYSPENRTIENRARPDSGRVSLNNCRGYGPSYRLLPKRDRQSICSGRDELCNAVLNDAWASHPTWASEDSGFIAHRKNVHEEGLHRIEEERHDYDHHILVCERGIQILEPIAQQIANTPQEALHQMRLDPDFAVTNHFVFKTSLSKIYGREHAASIINSLPERPAPIVPVMLLRMRQKLEEWKMVQREWEKVWRDQTQKMFWRSLDHQNVQLKNQDKRQFQSKTLQNEIAVKFAEQQKAREKSAGVVPYQMKFVFTDKDVLFDVSYLLLTYTEHMFNSESPKLQAFIKDFVPLFFDIDSEAFSRRMQEVNESSKPNDEMEEDTPASETSNQSRARKSNGKKGDLLRDVLDKSRKPTRGDRESSVASGSRASTPDVATTAEEDAAEAKEAAEEEVKHKTWFNHPVEGNLHQKRNVRPNEAFKRNIFNLYGNLNIYCFFRVFVLLYERLLALKQSEKEVAETVRKEKMHKPAEDFGIIDRKPQDFWRDVGPSTNYYQQILDMLEEVAKNNDQISMGQVEEVLRRYYLSRGYLLYTYEKMMSALTRFVIAVYSNDAKDRSNDIMTLFFKDRKKEMTTHQDEVTFRKQVEKYVKEGDIYRIAYVSTHLSKRTLVASTMTDLNPQNHNSSTATVRLMRREENTFDLHGPDYAHVHGTVTPEDRWRLYVTLYSSLEPTEGIARAELRRTFTKRTLRLAQKHLEQIVEKLKERKPEGAEDIPNRSLLEWRELLLFSREELQLRVSPTTYAIIWGDDSGEEEWTSKPFLSSLAKESSSSDAAGQIDQEGGTKEGEQHHEDDAEAAFLEKFVMNNSWMAGRKREEVDEMNREFREWVGDGNSNGGKKEEDVVMVE